MDVAEHRTVKLRRCFIVAPLGAANARIVGALNERGIECLQPDELVKPGAISEELVKSLANADFVVALLNSSTSPKLAFELGAAYAFRKPILVFTTGLDTLLFDLHGMYIVNAPSDTSQDAGPDIDRFLRHAAKTQVREAGSSSQPPPGDLGWARDRLAALKQERGSDRGFAFERLIVDVFRAAGTQVVEVKPEADMGGDLIVWQNDIAYETGGPIIIECKYYGGGSDSILMNSKHSVERLEKFVTASDAKLGLLVFSHDRPDVPHHSLETPHVLIFGAEQLIALVEHGAFAEEVLQRRRRISYRSRTSVEPT